MEKKDGNQYGDQCGEQFKYQHRKSHAVIKFQRKATTGFAWAHRLNTYWRKLAINMMIASLFSQADQ